MPDLSLHFSGEEFTRTNHREYAEENERLAEPWVWENGTFTALTVLEPLRVLVARPIWVISFFRCWALNKAVGGSKNSYHMLGLAADIWPVGFRSLVVPMAFLKQGTIPFDLAIYEMGGRWLHIQAPKPGNEPRRRMLMSFPDAPDPVPWDPTDPRVR
jgi:hypothetical protein